MRNTWRTITLITVTAFMCSAHVGDRVVPIFEIPEESFSEIDIHDGDIEDWLNVIGEPSLTGLDLTALIEDPNKGITNAPGEEYDPSDLDFRIWLAWHRGLNRIYAAAEGVDDVLVEPDDDDELYWDGVVILQIDGDHSGGVYSYKDGDESQWQSVQGFVGGPMGYWVERQVRYPEYCKIGSPETTCWFQAPPFADVGGATYGENPTVWMTEMYVTPFDRLVPDSAEETVVTELRPGGIIGLLLVISDDDNPPARNKEATFTIPPIDPDSPTPGPVEFADGLLVPVGGLAGSAVESVTWGRIKASLQP